MLFINILSIKIQFDHGITLVIYVTLYNFAVSIICVPFLFFIVLKFSLAASNLVNSVMDVIFPVSHVVMDTHV